MLGKIKEIISMLKSENKGVLVDFPVHLHIPLGAESIDIVDICELDKKQQSSDAVLTRLITLNPQQGSEYFILSYGIFTDVENAADIEFFIKVNGKRVLRLHGRPDSATNPQFYKINFGLAPDLSNDSLKACQILLTPNDTLTVDVVNRNEEVTAPVGVRIVGYVLNNNKLSSSLKR